MSSSRTTPDNPGTSRFAADNSKRVPLNNLTSEKLSNLYDHVDAVTRTLGIIEAQSKRRKAALDRMTKAWMSARRRGKGLEQLRKDCQSYADLASGAERARQFHKRDADRYEETLRGELSEAQATLARVQAVLDSSDDMVSLDDIRTALNLPDPGERTG